jgi:hypothetical protein
MTRSLLLAACALLAPARGLAWESVTHAGLADRAVAASPLDDRLRAWGVPAGLDGRVALHAGVLPRPEAVRLRRRLERLDAALGVSPDPGGVQRARGWIVAGAAAADIPWESARHHFLEPRTGAGLEEGGAALAMLMSVMAASRACSPARTSTPPACRPTRGWSTGATTSACARSTSTWPRRGPPSGRERARTTSRER